jgi:8-oxo-dGTP pyrophosphatase MutT (NUDIX family)
MDTVVKIGVIVAREDGAVLLIKERLKVNQTALWNIIKGTYDGGETIFDAAIRECFEEASVRVELTHALGVHVAESDGKMRVQFNFVGRIVGGTAKIASAADQATRDESIEEVRWFSRDELNTMAVEEFVSGRAHDVLSVYLAGTVFPLAVYKQVLLK